MCFSATGSFTLAGVLAGVGAVSTTRSSSEPQRLFAAIPLLFATQQLAEGTVWLSMDGTVNATLGHMAVLAFLGVALAVWPMWLPLSLQRIEQNPARRRILTTMCWFGAAVSVTACIVLLRSQPVPVIAGHSIQYQNVGTSNVTLNLLSLLAYSVPTLAPFFVSTAPLVPRIGILFAVSLVIAFVVQRHALTSVWCFFAAILSALILVAVSAREQSPRSAIGYLVAR